MLPRWRTGPVGVWRFAMLHAPKAVFAAVGVTLAWTAGTVRAEQRRFHYVPVDAAGNSTLQPNDGGVGERLRLLGATRGPDNGQPRPTHLVTFRHPYNGRNITVPMTLPESTPVTEY